MGWENDAGLIGELAMAAILLERVTRRFGGTTAVDDLSLEIPDHEFLVLVGPSGCGKSTVLRIIAGLERPDAGRVVIGDRLVNDVEPKDRDVAMVFQNYALYPHMSVFDNIAFGIRARGMHGRELRDHVERVADQLGLGNLLKRKPAQLSGGQRQRVALGRAIVRTPLAFLMDEPLSNLDAKLRIQTRRDLAHLHESLQTTTVYVTHDQVEAMTLGQRVAVIGNGRMHQVGPPQEVYDRPANLFVAQFIGSPPMNCVPARREGSEVTLAGAAVGGGLGARLPRNDGIVVGFRPEALRLGAGPAEALSFTGSVLGLERLGSQLNLEVVLGGSRVVAVVPVTAEQQAFETGAPVPLWCGPESIHLFDEATGARLP